MVSRSFDDFLLAFGQANAFVFNSTAQMQSAAKNMWADIKDRPDEVEAFIKEVISEFIIQKLNKIFKTNDGERGRTSAWRDKDSISITYWYSAAVQAKLGVLLRSLKSESEVFASDSALIFADLAVELLRFQERNFGRGCRDRSAGMMIPVSCFYDFREMSSFASIIKVSKAFCQEQGIELKDFDLSEVENIKFGLQLFKRLRKTLRHKMKKVIYFSEKIDGKHRETLKSIAEMNGATISESKEDATHLIYQHSHFRKPSREHCTPLKTWDDRVLVHWWFSPPSYQTWVDAELVPTTDRFENTDLERPNQKWKLSHYWIENSYLYNEWMNEWDYELNPSNTEHIGPAKHPVFKAFKPLDSGDPSLKRKDNDLTSPVAKNKSRRSRNASKVEEDLTKGNFSSMISSFIYLSRNGKSRSFSTSRARRDPEHTARFTAQRQHSTFNKPKPAKCYLI